MPPPISIVAETFFTALFLTFLVIYFTKFKKKGLKMYEIEIMSLDSKSKFECYKKCKAICENLTENKFSELWCALGFKDRSSIKYKNEFVLIKNLGGK